jgi:hypothetical protein
VAEPVREVLQGAVSGTAAPDVERAWHDGRRARRRRRNWLIGTVSAFVLVPAFIAWSGVWAPDPSVPTIGSAARAALLPPAGGSYRVSLREGEDRVVTRLAVERDVTGSGGERLQVQRLDTTKAAERSSYRLEDGRLVLVARSSSGPGGNEACAPDPPILVRTARPVAGDRWEASARCVDVGDAGAIDLAIDVTVRFDGASRASVGDDGDEVVVDVWRFHRTERTVRSAGGAVVATTERTTDERFAPALGINVSESTDTVTTVGTTTRRAHRDLRLLSARPDRYPTTRK